MRRSTSAERDTSTGHLNQAEEVATCHTIHSRSVPTRSCFEPSGLPESPSGGSDPGGSGSEKIGGGSYYCSLRLTDSITSLYIQFWLQVFPVRAGRSASWLQAGYRGARFRGRRFPGSAVNDRRNSRYASITWDRGMRIRVLVTMAPSERASGAELGLLRQYSSMPRCLVPCGPTDARPPAHATGRIAHVDW